MDKKREVHYPATLKIDKSIKSEIISALDACDSRCYAEFDIIGNLVRLEPDNERRSKVDQLFGNGARRLEKDNQV